MFRSLFGTRPATVTTPGATGPVKQMNARELQAQLDDGQEPLLVDVRTPQEYAHDGHIAGSRLLPLQVLMQRSDELPKDRPIVCVCRSGNRSQVACEQLATLGYTDLTNLAGGMIGWKSAGLPYE